MGPWRPRHRRRRVLQLRPRPGRQRDARRQGRRSGCPSSPPRPAFSRRQPPHDWPGPHANTTEGPALSNSVLLKTRLLNAASLELRRPRCCAVAPVLPSSGSWRSHLGGAHGVLGSSESRTLPESIGRVLRGPAARCDAPLRFRKAGHTVAKLEADMLILGVRTKKRGAPGCGERRPHRTPEGRRRRREGTPDVPNPPWAPRRPAAGQAGRRHARPAAGRAAAGGRRAGGRRGARRLPFQEPS